MAEPTGTTPSDRLLWVVAAAAAAGALAAIQTRQLIILIRWERTLAFARDFLPGAIASAAMALAAYLLILVLVLRRQKRKWGLALGAGWGAIVLGTSLWALLNPYGKNLWQELLLQLHLTRTLIRYRIGGNPQRQLAAWVAGLGGLLVLGSAKGFADCPRDRLDRGMLMAAAFYAALYFLAIGITARLVTPH